MLLRIISGLTIGDVDFLTVARMGKHLKNVQSKAAYDSLLAQYERTVSIEKQDALTFKLLTYLVSDADSEDDLEQAFEKACDEGC